MIIRFLSSCLYFRNLSKQKGLIKPDNRTLKASVVSGCFNVRKLEINLKIIAYHSEYNCCDCCNFGFVRCYVILIYQDQMLIT